MRTLVRSEVVHQRLAAVIYRESRTLSPAMKSFIQALKQPVGATN
jgi:DNA-binding transcriptional LysR family regulator